MLSIIIPTKDRGHIFTKTLDAIYLATAHIISEIIIINDSKTSSLQTDTKYQDKVTVINNPKSGVASARNLGAKIAKYQNLLFLDDDILVSEENISALITISSQNPDSAINFNWIYPESLTEKIKQTQFGRYLIKDGYTSLKGWSRGGKWSDTELFEIDLIASYFLCIKKSDFTLAGGYNENFPHAGAEDFEFAMRLKKIGIKNLCYPLSFVLHNEEDRMEIKPWLERKKRGGETRVIAAKLGYTQMAIHASIIKVYLVSLLFF